jgi:hypothetical protein
MKTLRTICRTAGLISALCLPGSAQLSLGRIEGKVQIGSGQPVAGASVMATPIQTPADGSLSQPFYAVSADDGTFVLDKIPANVYWICGRVFGSELLDPCTWSASPVTVNLSDGAAHSGIAVTLAQGRFVHVRVGDASHLLQKADRDPAAAPFLVYITGPKGTMPAAHLPQKWGAGASGVPPFPVYFLGTRFLTLAALVADDNGGRTFEVVAPFDTDLTLIVNSGTLQMLDKAGKPLSKGIVQPPPLNGKPQPPIQSPDFQQPFKISKADAPLTFEFTVTQP